MKIEDERLPVGRRKFLAGGAAALLTTASVPFSNASAHTLEKKLSLSNLNTGESASLVYWADGHYVPEELARASYLLRDFHTGDVRHVDLRLLEFLHTLAHGLDVSKPIEVISAYRSPRTNARLRKTTRGVAKNSLHMSGKAIDIRVPGYKPSQVGKAARAMQTGGVGTYRRFVHLDVGDVRAWWGG